MPTPVKEEKISDLNDRFSRAKAAVLANYQGISAQAMAQLRLHMRERSLEFMIIKNTLAKRAAKNTPFEVLDDQWTGPMSIVISYDDVVAPAKAIADYAKSGANKAPEVLCGVIEGKAISAEQVKALSELPSKEALIAQMLSVFNGPATQFVGVLNGVMRQFVGTLDAIREKKAQG